MGFFFLKIKKKKEVGRATTIDEFRDKIKDIPVESLLYHAERHHFSNWLAARTEFKLASKLRPVLVLRFVSADFLGTNLFHCWVSELTPPI